MSSNVGKLEVVDATKAGRPVHYDAIQRRGLILQGSLPNLLELMFIMTHYGNLTKQAELQVTW